MRKIILILVLLFAGLFSFADVRVVSNLDDFQYLVPGYILENAYECDTIEDIENLVDCPKQFWTKFDNIYSDKEFIVRKIVVIMNLNGERFAFISLYDKYVAKVYLVQFR